MVLINPMYVDSLQCIIQADFDVSANFQHTWQNCLPE
jgi:hypothetical protein